MRKALQTALLIGASAAGSFSQQAPDRRFVQPPSRPEIVPPGFLADRDPVRVDPQHFRLDFQNQRVRVVHLTMKESEGSPMHEEPDILAVCIKECHVGPPASDPFLWENGRMIDLGTLGGTCGFPNEINNRGQVVGTSHLAGNATYHPFSWDRGALTDLGTLGGDNGEALWVNDAGEVIGWADLPGAAVNLLHHGFLWRNGVMTDLGTLGSTSFAEGINSKGQIVGRSRIGSPTSVLSHAFLWEHGGPMIDLNNLIPANSPLLLLDAAYINDRGEISGHGLTPSGDNHAFLLVPDGQDETLVSATHASTVTQHNLTPGDMMAAVRARLGKRYHIPSLAASPRDWL